MLKKRCLILLLLPLMSFADREKAGSVWLDAFYLSFEKALKKARHHHTWCAISTHPNSLEISPMVKYTRPGEDYGLTLMEQYTNCYRDYAQDSLTLICEEEKALRAFIQSLEEEGDIRKTRLLEFKKEQLSYLILERRAQEEKGSVITAKAYESDETAKAIHGFEEFAENRDKLSHLGYGKDSCDKILGIGMKKAGELGLEPFYLSFKASLKQAQFDHEDCVYFVRPNLFEITGDEKFLRPDASDGPFIMEQYTSCYEEYIKKALTPLCQKEREIKQEISSSNKNWTLGFTLPRKHLSFFSSERQHQEIKASFMTARAYQNDKNVWPILGLDKAHENLKTLSDLSLDTKSCNEILGE